MPLLESIIGGGVGKLFKDVVGTFKLSPEAKLEFDKAMAENTSNLAKIDAELEAKLADSASANIRAEASSGDKYTSRARPTFLYVVEAVIGWNFIAVPIWNKVPIVLPNDLYWLFGSVMLGYTGARTWEKLANAKKEK